LAATILLIDCGGNSGSESQACTASVEPGLSIRVLDDASGISISGGARAVVTAAAYTEVAKNPAVPGCSNTLALIAALERPGAYAVTVSQAGYFDFIANHVVVAADSCHVHTVVVEAKLVAR
jgi:hypothetical protein